MEIHHEINPNRLTLKTKSFPLGKTSLHWHEKIELVQAIDHPFDILIEGERYEVEPGDVVLIGERVIHLFDIREDNTQVRIGQFPYSILLGSGVTPAAIKPVIKREELDADSDFAFKVDGILNTISRELVVKNEENPFLQMMLAALYFLLMSRFGISSDDKGKKEKGDFYRVVEYVNGHFKEKLTVKSIAASLYMDRGRLSELFFKYSATSLNGYINSLRISYAENLIHSGSSIIDAALESGFQSVRTFNEVYKRSTGRAPSNIKKKKK